MLSLLLILILNFSEVLGFTYYETPLTFSEAKARCKAEGSRLATIVNGANRMEALAAINGRQAPWIGLEHEFLPKGKCHFYYPDDPDPNVCPLTTYQCVKFWKDYKPLIVGEGGYECTAYDPVPKMGNGAVTNEYPCETKRPFLCTQSAQICDVESWDCRRNGQSIEYCAFGEGIGGRDCFCDLDVDGVSRCRSNFGCGSRPLCTENAQCPAGQVCTTAGCCNQQVCVPLCGEDRVFLRRRGLDEPRRLQSEMQEDVAPCSDTYCPSI